MILFTAIPNKVGVFITSVSGVTTFYSVHGVYNASGMNLVSAPNSTQALILQVVDAVEISQPYVLSYLDQAFGE